jgi:hypothetical protein
MKRRFDGEPELAKSDALNFKVNSSLMPSATNSFDLGSAPFRYRSINTHGISVADSELFFNTGPNTRRIYVTSPAPDAHMVTTNDDQALTNKTIAFSNATSGYVPSVLSYYEEASGTLDWSCGAGITSSPATGVAVTCTRIGRVSTITIPSFQLTTGGTPTSAFISSTSLATAGLSRFLPSTDDYLGCVRIENGGGIYVLGFAYYSSATNVIQLYRTSTGVAAYTGNIIAGLSNKTHLTFNV